MAKLLATKYASVYERVGAKDTSFIIKYRLAGKIQEEIVGKKLDGMTAKKASEILEIRKNNNIDKQLEIVSSQKAKLSFHNLALKYFEKLWLESRLEENLDVKTLKNKTAINIKREESLYKNFWGPWKLRILPLSQIREKNVYDFIKSQTKYGEKSIYNALMLSKSILKHTVHLHSNLHNPFLLKDKEYKNKITKVKDSNRKEYLSTDECVSLLKKLKEKGIHQNYTIVLLSLMTGARPASVLQLKVKDINYRKKEINFYDFKRKMIYQAKLTIDLESALLKQSETLSRDNYLFYSNDVNKALSDYPSSIKRTLDKLFNDFKKDGEERIVPYTFRHTFANLLLQKHRVPIFEVSALLNHASVKTTIDNYITFNHDLVVKDLMLFESSINANSESEEDLIMQELTKLNLQDDVVLKIRDIITKLTSQ